MKIRKSISILICVVVLSVLSLPVSFAFAQLPTVITCNDNAPLCKVEETSTGIDVYYIVQVYNHLDNTQSSDYLYYQIIAHVPTSEINNFYVWFGQGYYSLGPFISPNTIVYDSYAYVPDVGLWQERENVTGTQDFKRYWGSFNNPVFYVQLPDGYNLSYAARFEQYLTNEPFIKFKPNSAEVNQIRSPLSEPVADEHNAYFVVNEFLYWVSYRINTIYGVQSSIEGSTESYSGSGSYSEENSVVYHEQATVEWQNELSPINSPNSFYGTIANNDNDTFSGILRDLHLSSYGLGVSLGNGSFSYNGQIYVPYSINSNLYSEPYELCVTTLSNNSISIDFLRHSSLYNDILIDADIYLSIFKVSDGSYVKSEIKNVSGAYAKVGWTASFNTEDVIESVKMYGPAFINTAQIPVNLSSIIWQYDLEFKEWRDNMLSTLTNIYNVLSQDPNVPEAPTYQDWASGLAGAEQNYSNVTPQDIKLQLNSALGNGTYDNAAAQIKAWVSAFSIPQLISLCVVALALGTVTLTLGKKKSE